MGVAKTGTLHHTCFVVNDLEATAQELAEDLSVSWNVWTIEPTSGTVHSKEAAYSFRVAIAQVGGSNLELVAPHKGDSVYQEHLASQGEGFHHTCIAYDSHEAMHAARDELMTQGREMIQSGVLGDLGEFCYFWMPEMGSALELLFLSELPPPEMTIG